MTFESLYASTYDALYRDKDYDGEWRSSSASSASTATATFARCSTSVAAPATTRPGSPPAATRSSASSGRPRCSSGRAGKGPGLDHSTRPTFARPARARVRRSRVALRGVELPDDRRGRARRARYRAQACSAGRPRRLRRWYGPAVLHQRPSPRFTRVPLERGKLLRTVTAELDEVATSARRLPPAARRRRAGRGEDGGGARGALLLPRRAPSSLLERSRLELVRLSAFPDVASEPDETTWNVLVVADLREPRRHARDAGLRAVLGGVALRRGHRSAFLRGPRPHRPAGERGAVSVRPCGADQRAEPARLAALVPAPAARSPRTAFDARQRVAGFLAGARRRLGCLPRPLRLGGLARGRGGTGAGRDELLRRRCERGAGARRMEERVPAALRLGCRLRLGGPCDA